MAPTPVVAGRVMRGPADPLSVDPAFVRHGSAQVHLDHVPASSPRESAAGGADGQAAVGTEGEAVLASTRIGTEPESSSTPYSERGFRSLPLRGWLEWMAGGRDVRDQVENYEQRQRRDDKPLQAAPRVLNLTALLVFVSREGRLRSEKRADPLQGRRALRHRFTDLHHRLGCRARL